MKLSNIFFSVSPFNGHNRLCLPLTLPGTPRFHRVKHISYFCISIAAEILVSNSVSKVYRISGIIDYERVMKEVQNPLSL